MEDNLAVSLNEEFGSFLSRPLAEIELDLTHANLISVTIL